MRHRTWIPLILTIFSVFFVSCKSTPDAQRDTTILLNMSSGEPPTLDPTQAVDLSSGIVMKMIFEGLTRVQPDGKPAPATADRIEVSDDGTVYRFYLRRSFWSNGTPVTAEDFAYAWRLALSPTYPANYAYQLYVIKNALEAKEGKLPIEEVGIRVLDRHTLEVELVHPIPYFPELAAFHAYYPIPHAIAKRNPDWAANAGPDLVTNGPFNVVEWRHHSELLLKKNPRYWDRASVRAPEILLSMIEDANTELHLFEEGDLHWAGRPLSVGLPSDAIPSLKDSGALQVLPMLGTYFYKFNTDKFPLNHKRFRQALCLAINRQVIVDHITQAGEVPALGLVPTSISPNPQGYFKNRDLTQARKLLQELLAELDMSLEDLPVLELAYNTNEAHHKIAQIVQQQWLRDLGIRVELKNYEWKVYLDVLSKQNYQIGRLAWIADFHDPINFLEPYKYPDGGNNSTGWENVQYTRLLDEALAERDPTKRAELLRQAETILMDETPLAPVYHMTTAFIKSDRLQGVFISTLGDIDFKWAYVHPHNPGK